MTPWGGELVVVDETTSTMDDARRLEADGYPSGSVVRAEFQTQGRGRHLGRSWASEPGKNLLFTGFWRPDQWRVPSFSPALVSGLALCRWIDGLGLSGDPRVALKWPNDVYVEDRKIAGILVTRQWSGASSSSIHVGVGLNLKTTTGRSGFRSPATALSEWNCDLSPADALDGVLDSLFQTMGLVDPRTDCLKRLWRQGETLTLTVAGESLPRSGLVRGLTDDGSLQWETPLGLEILRSAE